MLSPDGQRVAMEIDNQIWLYDLARDTLTRFTFEGDAKPKPKCGRLTGSGLRSGQPKKEEWEISFGNGRTAVAGWSGLSTDEYLQVPTSWSPDGKFLAFQENNPKTARDIWVLRMSDRKSQPFLVTPFNEGGPDVFSPMATGWPMFRMNPGAPKFMCSRFRVPAGNGKSRRRAARSRPGTAMGRNCFTATATR